MVLDRVKLIMAISNPDKDALINEIIGNFTNAVNLYCGTDTLPTQLEYVVVEATISRMNRIGSEGLKSENIDVIGLTYIEDILEPYKPYMDAYKQSNKKVRFL
jgi:hypothetical protein